MKKKRPFRDATQIAAKLGLEVGQRWRVGGYQASFFRQTWRYFMTQPRLERSEGCRWDRG
jgi:hypothetical protein